MLKLDTALELMNKYGYSSITAHPYLYQAGEDIGVCYTYIDEDYGKLERIILCNNEDELKRFLEAFKWFEINAKQRHVRMILDNYESPNPKVMFLRNEKIMLDGEMFDIENYDLKEKARESMDNVSKIVYEAGDLLLVYNEIKNRQLSYLKSLLDLKNELRTKYFNLQKEVDIYNRNKIKRELVLITDVHTSGINENLETSLKDRYNKYIVQMPDILEAQDFLKEVWDLNYNLEINQQYYNAIKEDSEIRKEMKIVDQKIAFMKDLNDDIKPLFGVDLIKQFQNINHKFSKSTVSVSEDTIKSLLDSVNKKYAYYSKLDPLYTSEYLKEAIQNSNYEDLSLKYSVGTSVDVLSKFRIALNDVASDLTVKYKEKLSLEEQSILVIYNNEKYRTLCDVILNIPDFQNKSIKDIVKALSSIKKISKLKSECYGSLKRRIDLPQNATIKSSLFSDFDFTTFETFIESLKNKLILLKSVNEKMILPGDINGYLVVKNVNDLDNKRFVSLTNDLPGLLDKIDKNKEMIGIVLLKEQSPVLYAPYYFDLGDTFNKNGVPDMYIKEMVNFDLLVDLSDVIVNLDPFKTNVVNYRSVTNIDGNLTLVEDLEAQDSVVFCKYAFTSKGE